MIPMGLDPVEKEALPNPKRIKETHGNSNFEELSDSEESSESDEELSDLEESS